MSGKARKNEDPTLDLFGGEIPAPGPDIPPPGREPPTPQPGREPPTPEPGREPPTPRPGKEPPTPQPGREPPTPQPGREPPTPLPGREMPPPPPTAASDVRVQAAGYPRPQGVGGAYEVVGEGASARTGPPERADREIWTISQVNRAVRNLLEGKIPPLWVSGEVAGWKRTRSGHCYFTLKDQQAQIRCVMWRVEAERLKADPDDGMEVHALGALTLYESRGEYQLVVRALEAGGAEGLWRLAFERLRKKLEAEGLLAPERKRALPRCPASVGVVTSTSGAALKDILTTIRGRAPWTRVIVRNARVQGDRAALEVAEAVRVLARSGLVDVLIVGRGGGSIEDLWAFNEEPVARAIANSPVPVISAVGHEVDVTISDLVADLRAATPSAAAELAVQGSAYILEGLRVLPPRLSRALQGAASRRRRALGDAGAALGRALVSRVVQRRGSLMRSGDRLERAGRRLVERRRQRLIALAGKLEALSPLATLERGFSVALGPEGKVLRRVADFPDGRAFRLRVTDGDVPCRVEERAGAAPGDDSGTGYA